MDNKFSWNFGVVVYKCTVSVFPLIETLIDRSSALQSDGQDEEPTERKHVDVGARQVHEQTILDAGNSTELSPDRILHAPAHIACVGRAQDMYQKWLDGDDDVVHIAEDQDPFWEPTEDVLIGTGNIFLQSLAYALDFDDHITIADYKVADVTSTSHVVYSTNVLSVPLAGH